MELKWIAQNSSLFGTINMAKLPVGWRLKNHGGEHDQRDLSEDEAHRLLKDGSPMESIILVDGDPYTIYHVVGSL